MSATKTLPLSLLIPSGLSLSLLISLAEPLQAEPVPAPDGTGTLVTPDGQRYDIHGGTLSRDGQNLFHSFQQFGLTQTETANFISNPDIRNILGRVVGGDPSIINGLIQITGGNSNLFLINPAGILFGPNASLNVPADFTATTATGIGFGNNNWFNVFANNDYANLTGTPSAFIFPSTPLGTIINEGNLNLTPGSNLNLFANTVINTGTITVPGGNINISAVPNGNILRLSQPGHILSLEIENRFVAGPQPKETLPQLLTGGDPINHATTVQKLDDGTIRLTGSQTPIPLEPGITVVSGNMSVATGQMTFDQGQMTILGDKIALIGANIDASGTNGGGNIHIGVETGFLADSLSPLPQGGGGGRGGKGNFFAATHTYIDPNTTITANAINKGNGGQIIVWSDNTTQFHGNISATGTENGGFVEVSGKQNLIFRGNVDLSSANGQTGTLLLDPENIIIVSGSGGANDSQLSDNKILFGDTGTTFTISENALENLNGDANVILEATNDITIEDLADDNLIFKSGSGTIEFKADGDGQNGGTFSMNSGDTIRTRGRDITISGASVTTGNLTTRNSTSGGDAGNITIITSGGNITTGPLNPYAEGSGAAGDVTLTVTGGNGSINTTSGAINAGSADGTGGNIALSTAGGDITTGNLTSKASGSGTGGNITLNVTGGTGAIDTTAGVLNALSQTGQGGNIELSTANGNITTGEVAAGDIQAGTSGNITISVEGTTGNIDTTAQPLRASSGVGNAGSVTLTTGGGNITTGTINARPSPANNNGQGGDITIEVSGGTGAINTTAGSLSAYAEGGGDGGNITLRTASGNITTGDISSLANGGGTGGSVTLEVEGGTGSIDTSGGAIGSNVGAINSSANGGGNGGSISLSVAGGNITAGKLNSVANGQGTSGDIEIKAPIGTVNFTNQVDSGNLDITGTEIEFTGGNSSINGSGELLLQPGNASQNINLGATEGTLGLDISATDLAALQNGFTAINIGVADGTGNITLGDNASFKSPVAITGGSTLTGPNRNTTWTLTGANTGNLSGYSNGLTFTNIENLTGGTASDNFVFNAGASLTGIIDGGPGIDSLDYSNFEAPFTVNLAENIATATDGVFNIEDFIPSNTDSGNTDSGNTDSGNTDSGNTDSGNTDSGNTDSGNTDSGNTNSGNSGNTDSGNTNSGNSGNTNSGNTNSGNSGNTNSGNTNSGNTNSGNSGNTNSGNTNSGNSGNTNSGNTNSGNSGNTNSGNTNSGNSGNTNSGNTNSGNSGNTDSGNTDSGNSGNTNSGNTNSGNSGNTDSGNTDSGNTNSGNSGNTNSGNTNSGNSGNTNSGNTNSGNSGNTNSGNTNSGNSGNTNSGNTNSGNTNSGNSGNSGNTDSGNTDSGNTDSGNTNSGSSNPPTVYANPSLPGTTEPEVSPVITEESEVPPTTSPQVQTTPVAPSPVTPNLPSITLSDSGMAQPSAISNPPLATTPVTQVSEPVVTPVTQVSEPVVTPVTQVSEPVVTPVIQVSEPVVTPVMEVQAPSVNPDGLKPNYEPYEVQAPSVNPDGLKPNYEPYEGLTPNSELGVNVAIPLWAQPPQFTDLKERFLGSGANEDVAPTPPAEENSILSVTSREDIGLLLAAGNVSEAATAIDLLFSEEFENYLGYKSSRAYLSFGQLQNKLREQGIAQKQKPAIIYIFARTNHLDLILVPPEGKPIYKSVEDAPREVVLAKVAELKEEIANPTRRRTTSYLPAAQQLYQWTIAPLEADLKRLGIETLLVSPDAGLRTLPLAALHDGERFLVEKYSLSLIPSFYLTDIGVTADMRQAQVLAMGMSEFKDQSPLPAVPVEVKTIGQNLWSGEVFLNQDFTLGNLQKLQASNRNGILHLATHGQFQSGQPANSYIQMWDQKLSLDEMRSLNWRDLNVELLVLSACRTAVGDEGVEFGFAGLAVASGVKTAVASLWYANDAATLGLMSEFYYQLRSAPTKAEALRRAQISMLRGNVRVKASDTERELVGDFGSVALPSPLADGTVLQHPYFWSGFTAIGSPW